MPFKIEFVFLTEACQVLKLSLFDPRWRKEFQVSQRMQLEIDEKVTLKIYNVDTECVLLKHGTPAAMAVEYESLRELYSSFSDQCERDVVATPERGARWAHNATGTPTPNNMSQTPENLVRIMFLLV